jgi:hypothetical protein
MKAETFYKYQRIREKYTLLKNEGKQNYKERIAALAEEFYLSESQINGILCSKRLKGKECKSKK